MGLDEIEVNFGQVHIAPPYRISILSNGSVSGAQASVV
jgi:hypothetical protein